MKINEGLRIHDLESIVMPIISIDEFESKIDDSVIVVGFYVDDLEPAKDLNRFIQKGSVSIVDTDVSPAPNKEGYFMVFVEIPRDNQFPERVLTLLHSLKDLVKINTWTFKGFKIQGVKDVNEENLSKFIRLEKKKSKEEIKNETSMKEFFKYTYLDGLLIENDNITLKCGNWIRKYKLLGYGPLNTLYETHNLHNKPIDFSSKQMYYNGELSRNLGPSWIVYSLDKNIVIQNPKDGKIVVLNVME